MTTTNREGVKVYSYIRVSTSIQVDGYSLDAQRQAIQNYANYEKMHIVREYADEGFSGKNIAGREQFQEMLEDIQSDRDGVKFVLVFKLSRFGRNAADTLFSLQTMQDFGVNLISVDDKLDSSTDVGKVMISIMSSMAEMERDNIHAQTMAGRRQKARMGGWNGGFAPYGYKLINGHLTVEEEEAKVVRMIFDLFVNTTLGANGVAKKLNDDGIKKIVRQNGKLDAFTGHFVKLVLDNPVYMGKIAFGRRHTAKVNGKRNEYKVMKQLDESCIIIADGEHDALVSEELWRKAEAKRKETGIKKEKKEQDHEYILSGLIKCPCCGKGMYGIVSRSKKRKDGTPYPPYYSYSCRETMTKTGRQCEFGKSFSAPKLDEEVRKLIVSLVNTPDFAEAVKGLINKEIDVSELTERLANLQKQLRQLYSRQRHLEQQQDNLDFDAPNFDKMSESITRRLNDTFDEMTRVEGLIRETQTRIQNVEQQKLTQDSIYQFLLMFDKLYDKMTDMEKKTFMQSFIESIEIYRERQKDGHYVKAINFNFPVSYNGELVTTISPLKETTVESVVTLSKQTEAPAK